MNLEETISKIKKPGREIEPEAVNKINFKTKPPGSLGRLEEIAVKMCIIQGSLNPSAKDKAIFVFAGDHGIAMEGVSAFPSEVTPQMVINFINGGAAINVLCRLNGIDLRVIDMGVNYDFNNNSVIDKKIRKGTSSFLSGPAMTRDEAVRTLENGIEAFEEYYSKRKISIAGMGDMGIGNTTSSSAIISAITGASPEETTGRGTGIDDSKLKNKIEVIRRALEMHRPDKNDGIDILQKTGGFEIGGIAGAILAAAANRVPVILDGIISTAGGLIAHSLRPDVSEYLFSAHRSTELGQKYALEKMGLKPLLELDMRLGEGTGAALAMNLVDASCRIMTEMASFEEAGVSNKE